MGCAAAACAARWPGRRARSPQVGDRGGGLRRGRRSAALQRCSACVQGAGEHRCRGAPGGRAAGARRPSRPHAASAAAPRGGRRRTDVEGHVVEELPEHRVAEAVVVQVARLLVQVAARRGRRRGRHTRRGVGDRWRARAAARVARLLAQAAAAVATRGSSTAAGVSRQQRCEAGRTPSGPGGCGVEREEQMGNSCETCSPHKESGTSMRPAATIAGLCRARPLRPARRPSSRRAAHTGV